MTPVDVVVSCLQLLNLCDLDVGAIVRLELRTDFACVRSPHDRANRCSGDEVEGSFLVRCDQAASRDTLAHFLAGERSIGVAPDGCSQLGRVLRLKAA